MDSIVLQKMCTADNYCPKWSIAEVTYIQV